ncbi:hypothetical protein JTE90_012441 [Oedothorax gibbosus]|uniref:Uncharacterized protein n=1 Tax=Oedothorax gibbosus TaxID=931172 RepID=A0AAV6TF33_9ARAC|nr:hypothetical protein JTE90_012441 [Oedothorax gibbosus]
MGTDRHENYTISLGFSRANRGAPDTARDRCFYENSVPISGRADSRDTNSYKEKNNSSPVLRRRLRVRLRYRLGPEGPISVSGWGILTPFPFGRQRDKHEHVFAFRETLARNGFLRSLRPTDPCSTAVHMETLLQLQSSRFSLE